MAGPEKDCEIHEVGAWRFDPARNALLRNGEARSLEFRAARLLELLCRRRGEVVSQEEIVAAVWQGRRLSDNTVAVVISNLRKELGDDARAPRFIETVSKRGYRLLAEDGPATAAEASERGGFLSGRAARISALALAALGIVIAGLFALRASPVGEARTIITINTIENASGDERLQALAATAGEFSADHLSKAGDSVLIRDFNDGASWKTNKALERLFGRKTVIYHLSGKVVTDAGAPYVVLNAVDGRDWSIIWTSTVPVEDDGVGPGLQSTLNSFLAEIGRLKKKTAKTA